MTQDDRRAVIGTQPSTIAAAQIRLLDDAQQAWMTAIGALDTAKGSVEALDRAHLLDGQDYWEAITAIDSVTTLLEELRDMVLEQIDEG